MGADRRLGGDAPAAVHQPVPALLDGADGAELELRAREGHADAGAAGGDLGEPQAGARPRLGQEIEAAGTATSTSINFFTALRNSVIICTLITLGQVVFCSMAAYAFARLRFPGRDKFFFLYLTAMMIPPIFTLIPNFVLIKNLGWLNTYAGIIAPFFLMTPFAVFFLRQFFLGISREVEEAALLDGASRWKIFRQLILPMSAAPLTTLAVLTYITPGTSTCGRWSPATPTASARSRWRSTRSSPPPRSSRRRGRR